MESKTLDFEIHTVGETTILGRALLVRGED